MPPISASTDNNSASTVLDTDVPSGGDDAPEELGPRVELPAVVPYRIIAERPDAECGEFLYEHATGRCVYRYWSDADHYKLLFYEFDQPLKEPLPEAGAFVSTCAAGFDGQDYWIAEYDDPFLKNYTARSLVVFSGAGVPDSQIIDPSPVRYTQWRDCAPIHAMMAAIGCQALDHDDLLKALATSNQVLRRGKNYAIDEQQPGEFAWEDRPDYEYDLSLLNADVGLANLTYHFRGAWSGMWPHPTPWHFRVELDTDWQWDAELDFAKLVDPAKYASAGTITQRR